MVSNCRTRNAGHTTRQRGGYSTARASARLVSVTTMLPISAALLTRPRPRTRRSWPSPRRTARPSPSWASAASGVERNARVAVAALDAAEQLQDERDVSAVELGKEVAEHLGRAAVDAPDRLGLEDEPLGRLVELFELTEGRVAEVVGVGEEDSARPHRLDGVIHRQPVGDPRGMVRYDHQPPGLGNAIQP